MQETLYRLPFRRAREETPLKYGRDWVLKTAQCPDGTAWGLDYIQNGSKTLKDALGGFNRADWLIWFMVKADVITLEMAFDFTLELLVTHANAPRVKELLEASSKSKTLEQIHEYRGASAFEAETAMTLGDFALGHELSATTFLLRFKGHLLELDFDEALKDGQCVLNNIVAAHTGSLNFETPKARTAHNSLCDWLRARVVIQSESAGA